MRPAPSIVPAQDERDVYLVLDDFGRLGNAISTDEFSLRVSAKKKPRLWGKKPGQVNLEVERP
jgi:hypothetical protein